MRVKLSDGSESEVLVCLSGGAVVLLLGSEKVEPAGCDGLELLEADTAELGILAHSKFGQVLAGLEEVFEEANIEEKGSLSTVSESIFVCVGGDQAVDYSILGFARVDDY